MNSRLILFLILAAFCAPLPGYGEGEVKSKEAAQALAATLKFQQGEIVLKDGLATLRVPEDLRFLNGHDTENVLVKLWQNPPAQSDPIGMLMPVNRGPLDEDSWAVVITYEEDGYVKDEEAEKINYDDLLKQMKKDVHEVNKEREKQGFSAVELVGWAAPPRYDKAVHKLYWAKELKFNGSDQNTLNYNIRMLGRRGVLVLNVIAAMPQLPEIEGVSPKIIGAIDFNPGNRYADFNGAAGDKIAEYGIAALVAGGVAAKLGIFKGLWVLIIAGKKFVIAGIIAVVAGVKKLLGKKEPAKVEGIGS
jgi:uncharacterized membrane-anchored protein